MAVVDLLLLLLLPRMVAPHRSYRRHSESGVARVDGVVVAVAAAAAAAAAAVVRTQVPVRVQQQQEEVPVVCAVGRPRTPFAILLILPRRVIDRPPIVVSPPMSPLRTLAFGSP